MKKPVLLAALSLLNTFGVFAERASANYVLPFQTIPEPENVLVIECPSCILTDREGPSSSERVCLSGEEIAQALKTQPVLIRAERDILIEDQLTSSTPDHGLYLEAGRTILFEEGAQIALNHANFRARINQAGAGSGKFFMKNQSSIETKGGHLVIETAGADGEITLVQATIDTAGGNLYCKGIGSKEGSGKGFQAYFSHVLTRGYGIIQINGIGTSNGPNSHSGIVLNGTQIEAKDRALVLLSGTAGLGADTNHGIHLLGTTSIEAENGCIHFAGISNGQGNDNDGIWVEDGVKISSTKLAKVFMQGFGGPGVASNHGIRLSGSNSAITSNGGAVILLGQGRGTDTLNQGILLDHGINVLSKGRGMHAGPIILHGLGGLGSEKNNGIALNGRKTLISSVDSDILLTGVSHINDLTEPSVLIDFPSNIETKGRGRIRIKKETSK